MMTDPTSATEQTETSAEQKWVTYNAKMADLFAERDKHPMESPERETTVEAILSLWVAEG